MSVTHNLQIVVSQKGENIVNSVYVQYCYALPLRENQIKCAVLCGIQWSMEFMAPNEKLEGKKASLRQD